MFNLTESKQFVKYIKYNLILIIIMVLEQNSNTIAYPIFLLSFVLKDFTLALLFHKIYKRYFYKSIKVVKLYLLFFYNYITLFFFSIIHVTNFINYNKNDLNGDTINFTNYLFFYLMAIYQFSIYLVNKNIPIKRVIYNFSFILLCYFFINIFQYYVNQNSKYNSFLDLVALTQIPYYIQLFVILNTLLQYPDKEKLEN